MQTENIDRLCNDAARAIIKQIEVETGQEIKLETCLNVVQVIGQVVRQSEAAANRYFYLRDEGLMRASNVDLGTDCHKGNCVYFRPTFCIPEPVDLPYEDEEWSIADLDAAIDAAIAGETTSLRSARHPA